MNRTNSIKIFSISLVLIAVLSACGKKENAADSGGEHLPQVEVALPLKRKAELWDTYTSRIASEFRVDIKAQVGGYLSQIHFKDGDFVKKGDLLFSIDERPYKALYDASLAKIEEVNARIALAKSSTERAQTLYKTKSVSQEVLETRQSELLQAKASLLSAEAELEQTKINLDFTRLRAPISGIVSQRRVDEGNLIQPETASTLARIVSTEVVYAYFEVSESDLARYMESGTVSFLQNGGRKQPAAKIIPTGSSKEYLGTVTYIDNEIDADSSTLKMRAEIKNSDGTLIPGMFADLKLRTAGEREYLMLPETAVLTDMLNRYVVIVDDEGNVSFSPVEVGEIADGNLRIIKSGVKATDKVLIKGISRVYPGSKAAAKLISIEE